MAEVVNLRLARKAKKRAGEVDKAAANRAKFGQSKAAKSQQRNDAARADRLLDGAKLDRD